MAEDIIEVKEKINWKEEFVIQGKKVRDGISKIHSKTLLEFKIWYNLIPSGLLDQNITDAWENFDKNSSPSESDKWLDLFNKFWDWAYLHGLVMTLQEYDTRERRLQEFLRITRKRDQNEFKRWIEAGLADY